MKRPCNFFSSCIGAESINHAGSVDKEIFIVNWELEFENSNFQILEFHGRRRLGAHIRDCSKEHAVKSLRIQTTYAFDSIDERSSTLVCRL